jgi:hypothetical protein
MGFMHWAPDEGYVFMSEKSLVDGIIYELGHAFANEVPYFFIITYIAIALGAVAGPGLAMALYGGKLEEGESAKPWMTPVISLNAWVKNRFNFDNSAFAESTLAVALQKRLYIDHYYDLAMIKVVAGLSTKAAQADSDVIDGTIKTIETGS